MSAKTMSFGTPFGTLLGTLFGTLFGTLRHAADGTLSARHLTALGARKS
jgi:hypothetical protein